MEGLWVNLKGRKLADRCEDRIQDVAIVAGRGVRRVRSSHDMLFGLLRHAGLDL